MTRLGTAILALIVLGLAAFVSMTHIGGPVAPAGVAPPAEAMIGGSVRASARRPAGGLVLTVPVQGVARGAITDTWGQARSEGRVHHGTDMPAPKGTPVLAAASGTIEKLYASRLGGTTLYERSPDRHWTFYYAHLSGYAPGLHEGRQVRAGDTIAYVGDTGDAGPGNFHLHFGLTRTTPDQHWYQGEDVNAFPYLVGAPLPG